MDFEVQYSGRLVQQYVLGTDYEAYFLGLFIVCGKWISLARNCDFVVDMYFPKAE
jgi:hypothetical protein